MKTSYWALIAVLFAATGLCISDRARAQPPGSRGGEERGGDRGGRERGGWGGDRGSSDRGGSDRGSERGSERGSWGGDRGSFGGGPPGGFGGGPPGGRRGFDPGSFIERLDRNGNGMIDPDEMEGPAQMMISRLQREDPSIRTDRPIPVSKIREAFDRMRGGGDSGGSRDSSGRSDRERGEDTRAQLNAALTPAPLVPGFGEPQVLEPVMGFGPAAELLSVEVTPADLKTAEDLLQRYDRNKDGSLSGEEISSRWTGNPLDFDRNGDGKLSLSELSVRAARMRVAQAEVRAPETRRADERRRDRGDRPLEVPDPYNGRRSFASTSRALPEGLPGWFAEKDADGDHQVSMAEYSSQWTASLVEEFQSFDLNGDGVITAQECLAAIRSGGAAGGGGGAATTASRRSSGSGIAGYGGSRGSYGSRSGSSTRSSGSGSSAPAASAPAGQPDQKTTEYAQRIISRADKNKDGVLTGDEWKEMLVDPSAADANKDGRITVEEYAQWMLSRASR